MKFLIFIRQLADQFPIRLFFVLILIAVLGGWVSALWVSNNLIQDDMVLAATKTFDSDLLPSIDNTYSMGLQGNQLFKDAYISGNLIVGRSLVVGTTTILNPFAVATSGVIFNVSSTGKVIFNDLLTLGFLDTDPATSTTSNGTIFYNTSTQKFRGLENRKWLHLVGGVVLSYWDGALNGDIYNNNSGGVGVGFKRQGNSYGANFGPGVKLLVKGTVKTSQGFKFPDGRTWTIGKNSVFSTDLDTTLTNDGYLNMGRVFEIGGVKYFLYQRF